MTFVLLGGLTVAGLILLVLAGPVEGEEPGRNRGGTSHRPGEET